MASCIYAERRRCEGDDGHGISPAYQSLGYGKKTEIGEMIAPKTKVAEIFGPYTGQRISGTSGNVVEVRLTRVYEFDGLVVEIRDVPARMDQETEAIYLSARDMKRLDRMLKETVDAFSQRRRQGSLRSLRHITFKVELALPQAA